MYRGGEPEVTIEYVPSSVTEVRSVGRSVKRGPVVMKLRFSRLSGVAGASGSICSWV